MRRATREPERVYSKVWERQGIKGDLASFLGQSRHNFPSPNPIAPAGYPTATACGGGEDQNLNTKPSEPLVKSTFPGDWAIGMPRISRSSNVRK
jgi:hypothetical protein